jgi:hypothetical protein
MSQPEEMLMRNICLIAITLLSFGIASQAQVKTKSVVLPESAAQQLTHPCSRPGPPKFEGTWLPGQPDVQGMESRLSYISRLRSRGGIEGQRIAKPEKYYRQYVGIIVKGRKLIYVNSICDENPSEFWRDTPQDVCDGGCNWGVLYDTVSRKFSDLAMNGVG